MKNPIKFTKMTGSGNDFVVIDNRRGIIKNPLAFARKYCPRKFGIGADGLLLVETAKDYDFRMRYFNADGSRAAFCGNGARCISLFAWMNGIAASKMLFLSDAGAISAAVKQGSIVKIKMPAPSRIALDIKLKIKGKTIKLNFADTGVPHAVCFVPSAEEVDVEELGGIIRRHQRFAPEGTNADFVEIKDSHNIVVRTYERGVEGETLACGTGVVAASLISILKDYAHSPINAMTRGGELLKVYYDNKDIFFEGKVFSVFEGVLKP